MIYNDLNKKIIFLPSLVLFIVVSSLLAFSAFSHAKGLPAVNETVSNVDPASELVESVQNGSSDTTNEHIITKTAFSLIGEPKYSTDFTHFDYVNPDAPKGGTIKLAEIGNYDNFNRRASRGVPERNSGGLYESLFMQSGDELTSYYPLLASSITFSDNYQWAEVSINPAAHFSDGVPVTAQDVAFTFNKMMTEGVPQYRAYYKGVKVEAIDQYRVRFELPAQNREQLLTFVGDFYVLPQHFWQDKNLAEPLSTPPIGSAPYLISDYKIGQYVVYQLDNNYWGKDLPVNRGQHNFDSKKIEYYLDDSIALEAFKAGEYDFRRESQPKNWFTQYQGKYFDNHAIIKVEDEVTKAVDTRWLAFNLEKPIFKNLKVRQALTLAFDFAWLNHAFYYDSYEQPSSFFSHTPYAAKGVPSEQELEWLLPYEDELPESVFGEAYSVPSSDHKGFNRTNLLKAKRLFEEAGWVIKGDKLINKKTREPFEFELLAPMGADIKYAIPFQQSLAKLGIKMSISTVDYAQATRRLRKRDFDMMPTLYGGVSYPSSELMILWGSDYLNSSWNTSGLHNRAIDDLIGEIPNHITNEEKLTSLTRALDRVLTHEYPMIPMWSPRSIYYSHWDKFSKPSKKPVYTIGMDSWWFDANKAAKLSKNNE